MGSGTSSNIWPKGMYGSKIVKPAIARIANNKYFRGLLLNNGLLVLITNTITEAEIMDSVNQVVLKSSVLAFSKNMRMANVA